MSGLGSSDRSFAARVIAWQRVHGRHDLPWQGTRDPYRVWLSEVMLQQTQVATVLNYYPAFLARFPDVGALASAPLDEVLGLWSGLGYYSRARHLHRCAQKVVAEHGGRFPSSAAALEGLPGIGRSTAAAIAAFCFGERAAILDGNVKRVLARWLGFAGDLTQPRETAALWQQAQALLPQRDPARQMPAYTQGLMDLGSTVCTRSRPRCEACPVAADCVARRESAPMRYPVRSPRAARGHQVLWLAWLLDPNERVWLARRPAPGVWGGLHALPVFDSEPTLRAALPEIGSATMREQPLVRHLLTHKELELRPLLARLSASQAAALTLRMSEGTWAAPAQWETLGLPAPIRRLLDCGPVL